jgi:hypothetical protein
LSAVCPELSSAWNPKEGSGEACIFPYTFFSLQFVHISPAPATLEEALKRPVYVLRLLCFLQSVQSSPAPATLEEAASSAPADGPDETLSAGPEAPAEAPASSSGRKKVQLAGVDEEDDGDADVEVGVTSLVLKYQKLVLVLSTSRIACYH